MRLLILLLIFLLTGCASQAVGVAPAPPLTEPVGMAGVIRDTAAVTRGTVEQITVRHGIVRTQSQYLSFEANGHLAAIYVSPGDSVQAGDLLARLCSEDITETIHRLEADIAHHSRSQALANEMLVYEIALMQLNHAAAVRRAAETLDETDVAMRLMLEIENTELLHRQRQELRALDITDMQRRLAELREALPKTELRAPENGTVTFVMPINVGSWVNAATPILYINHCSRVFVYYVGSHLTHTMLISPRIVARINGQEYELSHTPMTREERFEARRRGIPERWHFDFVHGRPPVGAYASIMFYGVYLQDVLRIPINALFFMEGVGSYVYRVQDGELVITPVRVGARSSSFVQILEGLEERDEVLVR